MTERDPSKNFFAWHGWTLTLPRSWNPTQITGDFDKGQVLFADLDRPHLAIRWQRVSPRRFNSESSVDRTMQQEVGHLAATQAKPAPSGVGQHSLLYLDPDPPGRDVFISYSPITHRLIQITHPTRRRSQILPDLILPTLSDTAPDAPTPWSIFDLACHSPAHFRLTSHRLLAGDITLTFAHERNWLTIRQILIAHLALSRQSLPNWLADQQRTLAPHYKPTGNLEEFSRLDLHGFSRRAHLRTRFKFQWWRAREILTQALHDPDRDRLYILQGTAPKLLENLLRDLRAPRG